MLKSWAIARLVLIQSPVRSHVISDLIPNPDPNRYFGRNYPYLNPNYNLTG